MATIKVKKDFLKAVVGFNNSGAPLGKREDLHLLLNDAIGEDDLPLNEHITNMFETPLPKKAELKKMIEADLLKKADAVKLSAKAQKAQEVIDESVKEDPTILAPAKESTEAALQNETTSKKNKK